MPEDTIGNLLYDIYGDGSIVFGENGAPYVRTPWGDYYTTAAGTKEDLLARQYGNYGIAYVDPVTTTGMVDPVNTAANTGLEQPANQVSAVDSGVAWYDQEWRKIKAETGWSDERVYAEMTRRIEEANWNAGYQKLITAIANTGSVAERDQMIKEYQLALNAYKDSGIDVINDLKYLGITQGIGSSGIAPEYLFAPNNPLGVEREPTEQEAANGITRVYNDDGTTMLANAAGIPAEGEIERLDYQKELQEGILKEAIVGTTILALIGVAYLEYSNISLFSKPSQLFKLSKGSSKAGKEIVEAERAAVRGPGERPSWRQSEKEVGNANPEYAAQKSFKDGQEVQYGTKGSVRPDYHKPGSSIEVKNYDVSTPSGQTRLIDNISEQVMQRNVHLPEGTGQKIVIDVRGQNITNDVLRNIRDSIVNRTGGNVEIEFLR